MKEDKHTYRGKNSNQNEQTDNHTNVDLDLIEASNLFSRLSPEAQDDIIDLIKFLLSVK